MPEPPKTLPMSWGEWTGLDGTALAALIRSKQITAPEAASQAAAGVALLNPKLEAVVAMFDDAVANPDVDGPNPAGPLYGVPLFLKDLGSALKGRQQDSGSASMAGFIATATDPVVENFLEAGLVPIGRSTTPEFGLTFDTTTDYRGRVVVTRNPWDLSRTSGGSSGGSAAAVAAGIVPLSMASDGGGSIRIPAACCGLIGLKASRGRIPPALSRNEFAARVVTEGVVSRTVRDTAVAYDHLSRTPSGGSFIAMTRPAEPYSDAIRRPPGRLHIGLSTGDWGRKTKTDPEVAARIRDFAATLEALGHDVEEVPDQDIWDFPALYGSFITQWIGSRALFPQLAASRGIAEADLPKFCNPMTWRHTLAAAAYDKFDIYRMMAANNAVTRQIGRLMDRIDVLLVPTLAIRVPQANGVYSLLRDEALDVWMERTMDAARYTAPCNETGLPATSLPAGLDSENLPIGAQFYGNFGREDVLLQLAAQVEQAKPEWFAAIPPTHVSKAA
jgi:amidase